ncbi:MAG TPA: hypothetical protein VF331_08275 [Polyangiales bacterium]
MPSKDCPHMSACPMYGVIKLAGTLKVWQSRYCQADYAECARYKLSVSGQSVPQNLMPNGAYLKQGTRTSAVETG